jgi:hypothetical protein
MPPLLALTLAVLLAREAPSVTAQAAPVVSAAPEYVFPSAAGLLFFYVRPDKTTEFESVVARLSEVLDATADPTRRQQAETWRIFRSTEAARETLVYVFIFDPAVVGADYDPVKVLGEALPLEAQALYERLRASVVRVERMGLAKLR